MHILDTPEAIDGFRIRVLLRALKLECLGMKRGGQSVYSIVKNEFGFKGNKQKVYAQLDEWINDNP